MTHPIDFNLIDCCALTGNFLQQLQNHCGDFAQTELFLQKLFEGMEESGKNSARFSCCFQPETVKYAPILLKLGFTLYPAEHEEMRRTVQLLSDHVQGKGPQTLILSQGGSDFMQLLDALKPTQVTVLALGPCPASARKLVHEWIDLTQIYEENLPFGSVKTCAQPLESFNGSRSELYSSESSSFSIKGSRPEEPVAVKAPPKAAVSLQGAVPPAAPDFSQPSEFTYLFGQKIPAPAPMVPEKTAVLKDSPKAEGLTVLKDSSKPEGVTVAKESVQAKGLTASEDSAVSQKLTEAKDSAAPPKLAEAEDSAETEIHLSSEEAVSLLTFGGGAASSQKQLPQKKVPMKKSLASTDAALQKTCTTLCQELERRIYECQMHLQNLADGSTNKSSPHQFINTLYPDECMQVQECYEHLRTIFGWFSEHLHSNPRKMKKDIREMATEAAKIIAITRHFSDPICETTLKSCRNFLRSDLSFCIDGKVQFLSNHESIPSLEKLANIKVEMEQFISKATHAEMIQRYRGKLQEKIDVFKTCSVERSEEENASLINEILEAVRVLHEVFKQPLNSCFFREVFQPILPLFAEVGEYSSEFYQIRQAIDLANQENSDEEILENEEKLEENPMIQEVRKILAGKKLVLIGGIPVPHFLQRFEKTYQCKVDWFATSHGQSLDVFEPALADRQVPIFVVFVKWASHKHCEEFGTRAKRCGKKIVRVHNETNPLPVAKKILEMCSETLANHAA